MSGECIKCGLHALECECDLLTSHKNSSSNDTDHKSCALHALECECLCDNRIIYHKWISVKKDLPETLEPVLMLYKDAHGEDILTGYWDSLNREFTQTAVGFLSPDAYEAAGNYLHHKKKYITHWMPLPAPPAHFADSRKKVSE